MTEKVLKARMKINIKSTGKVLIAIVLALILVFAGYILGSKQSVLYQIKAAQEKIDGSGIFKEFQNKVSALAKIPVKLEISENEINKYINSADGADVKNIKINLSENGFMDLQCILPINEMKKHTDILPDFVYGFMPEETDLHLVIFFEVNNNIPLIKVAKAKMFNAELDTEAMEMLQINNIATDIIENQMRNILPQELFIKSMRIENKMIKISCEI